MSTEKFNKITVGASDDKRIPTHHAVISYPHVAVAGRVQKVEKLNIIINFDDVTGENKQIHNPNWL